MSDDWTGVVALDIDGVLHASNAADDALLTKLPIFEDWLRRHRHVAVVISSSWRHTYSLHELQTFFATDVRHQIIGTTGVYWREVYEATGEVPLTITDERGREVQRWLQDNGFESLPWAALEDEVGQYGPLGHRVVQVESRVGLEEHHLAALKRLLSDARPAAGDA